jgi:small conductance mechanosensitive channel
METIKNWFISGQALETGVFILKPLLVLLVCRILIGVFVKIANKILDKSKLDKGIGGFVKSSIKIVLWSIAIIIAADMVGINTASLVTLLGVVSLALSLSFQSIMTNVFSGITILLSKPFSVGDYVEIAGVGGTVKAIALMRTTLITPDNKIEFLPNSDVCAGRITNYSLEPERRVEIKVSVSYDATTAQVKEAVFDVLNNDQRIKQDDKKPTVRLNAYHSNDIEYVIRMWTDNSEYWNVYYDVLENLREKFAEKGIQFSYPHIVVHRAKEGA